MHLSGSLPVVVIAITFALSSCGTHQEVTLTTVPTTLPAPALPTVDADCGTHPAITRPASIWLACADGSFQLRDITWTSYALTSATGSAMMHANTCRPNCAGGTFKDYPADIELGCVTDNDGKRSFTQVTLRYVGAAPDPRRVVSFPIQ